MKATQTVRQQKEEPVLPLMHKKKHKWFIDAIYNKYEGWKPYEVKEILERKVEQAEQKVEQAEQIAKQAEQEAKQAEQEAKQTERKAQRLLEKSILTLAPYLAWDAEKIASHLEVEEAVVQKILARKKK